MDEPLNQQTRTPKVDNVKRSLIILGNISNVKQKLTQKMILEAIYVQRKIDALLYLDG